MKSECVTEMEKGNPVICMSTTELDKQIPEIINGIKLLLVEGFTYKDSIELYSRNVLNGGYPLDNFWTFDGSFTIRNDKSL